MYFKIGKNFTKIGHIKKWKWSNILGSEGSNIKLDNFPSLKHVLSSCFRSKENAN
jgi:hypothetical protein